MDINPHIDYKELLAIQAHILALLTANGINNQNEALIRDLLDKIQ